MLPVESQDQQFREADNGGEVHHERIHRVVDVEAVPIDFQRQAVDSTDLIMERVSGRS